MLVRHQAEASDVALFDLSGSPSAAATFLRSATIAAFAEGLEPPEWVMIMPLPGADSKVYARDGRRLFVPDLAALVRESNAALARQNGPGPVDKDHEMYSWWRSGGPVIAWAHEFEIRADGVYARTEWLPEAKQLIRDKLYRYTSGVFAWRMANIVRDEKWGYIVDYDIEPTTIRGFGITNIPALEVRAMFTQQEKKSMDPMKRILAKFGLSLDSSPEQLEAAITARFEQQTAAATPSLDQYVPRADFDAKVVELSAAKKQLKDQADAKDADERETLLQQALKDGKVVPASAEFYRQSMLQPGGVDRFKSFTQTAPVIAGPTPFLPSSEAGAATLSAAEKHACKVSGMTTEAYLAAKADREKQRQAQLSG